MMYFLKTSLKIEIGNELVYEAAFLTLGNLSESDALVFWTALCERAGLAVDFEMIHSICKESMIDMNDFMFALKG